MVHTLHSATVCIVRGGAWGEAGLYRCNTSTNHACILTNNLYLLQFNLIHNCIMLCTIKFYLYYTVTYLQGRHMHMQQSKNS